MAYYYLHVHPQPTGEYEIHTRGCAYAPPINELIGLGEFETCWLAILAARRYQLNVDGCFHCAHTCHIR